MNEQRENRRGIRVAVVFGGRNSEHAVSIMGAGSVIKALNESGYEVIPIGITTDGRWVLASESQSYEIEGTKLPEVEHTGTELALPSGGSELVVLEHGKFPELRDVDVVFPLLHGPFGEDGTIQGLLEMAGMRYIGSGVLASAVGMDKAYMKALLKHAGLPIGDHVVVRDRDWRRDRARVLKEAQELGWPVFVKPARAGSSQGISKANDLDELERAVEFARQHDPKVLIEAAIVGREVECAVLSQLDDEPPKASLPGEILVHGDHEFFDFEAKYYPEQMSLQVPADIPAEAAERVRELAVRAFEALGCEGLARVDFFYRPDGSLILNEINTLPGFTSLSVAPQLWAASGLSYPELLDHLIKLALTRPVGLR